MSSCTNATTLCQWVESLTAVTTPNVLLVVCLARMELDRYSEECSMELVFQNRISEDSCVLAK